MTVEVRVDDIINLMFELLEESGTLTSWEVQEVLRKCEVKGSYSPLIIFLDKKIYDVKITKFEDMKNQIRLSED